MNEQNLLEQLKDIHYPPPVSWWPLAPGWYFLGAALILTALFLGIWILRYRKRLKKRRQILAEFQRIKSKILKETDSVQVWGELSTFLKRFTLLIYPRQEVGGLHGEAWLRFLDAKGKTNAFTTGIGSALITIPYQSQPPKEIEPLIDLIENWVKLQMKGKL